MHKKIIALLCSFMLISSFTVTDCSTAAVVQPVAPAYSYTSECSSELSVSGTTLTCSSKLTGYYNVTDKIDVYQYLEKKNSSNEWETINSWTGSTFFFKASITNYKYSASSGTYRLKTKFRVFSGINCETITKYSATRTI